MAKNPALVPSISKDDFRILDERADNGASELCLALNTIKESNAFVHAGFKNFLEYLKSKNIHRATAYRMMEEGKIMIGTMAQDGSAPDRSQAAALSKVKPENRLAMWEKAVQSGGPKISQKKIKNLVRSQPQGNVSHGETPTCENIEPEDCASDAQNESGPVVPATTYYDQVMTSVRRARELVEGLSEEEAGKFLNSQRCAIDFSNILGELRLSKPFRLCDMCKGVNPSCKLCMGGGWISKSLYDTVPMEMRSQ